MEWFFTVCDKRWKHLNLLCALRDLYIMILLATTKRTWIFLHKNVTFRLLLMGGLCSTNNKSVRWGNDKVDLTNWFVKKSMTDNCEPQIQYHRSLDTRIYKTDIQFWSVLGSRGCRERKKSQTAISMLLLRAVFYVFMGKRNFNF